MCVGVMMWAGIKTCYYASTRGDAAEGGLSDVHLREQFDGTNTSHFDLIHLEDGREDCAEIWTEWNANRA